MPTEIAGIAPDPLREVVRLGRSDNITIPTLGSANEVIGQTIERNLLSAIIRPRIEEILDLLQDRMKQAKMEHTAGSRYVLTGGASQLTGLADLFSKHAKKSVGVSKPIGISGLDEDSCGAGFSAASAL